MKRSKFIKSGLAGLVGILFFIPIHKNENRYFEYYNNGWKKVKFRDIISGMYVQGFEPDGTFIVMGWKEGKPMYGALVTKGTYVGKRGVLTFESRVF